MLRKVLTVLTFLLSNLMASVCQAEFRISWVNRDDSGFDSAERAVIDSAIVTWEQLIRDLDGDLGTTDEFRLTVKEWPGLGFPAQIEDPMEEAGIPVSGSIVIDDGENMTPPWNGIYVSPNPLANSEYLPTSIPHYLVAKSTSDAAGVLDLFNVATHELGHLLGFFDGYSRWMEAIVADDLLDYGSGRVKLRGGGDRSHVSCTSDQPLATMFDLMCSSATIPTHGNGDRRLVSALDLEILAGIYGYVVDTSAVVTAPSGDFNQDGILTVDDIDALSSAIRQQENLEAFDLTFDGLLNASDRRVWVNNLKETFFGDANLDGEFNSSDLVELFVAGEYEDNLRFNSTWSTGDFDGDGEFESGDLVAAFTDAGYELGPRVIAKAVPEPTVVVLLAAGLMGAINWRRRSTATASRY